MVPLNNGLSSMAVQVLVESSNGSLYAGTNAGAFRSDDDGKSWNAIDERVRRRRGCRRHFSSDTACRLQQMIRKGREPWLT